MTHKRMLFIRKVSIIILFNLFFVVILFLITEGLSSSIFAIRKAFLGHVIAERKHTQYDEEIGWINIPNLSIDMYGGKSFIINSMSFRNDKEFSFSIPKNKVRVVCSGDSFTLGYGVGNDDTWCKLLESINDRIETVNLGQGGYGVDQAYLWYKRNSSKLEHNIQIFAVITDDFRRMRRDTFGGYGKPFLVLQNDVLINKNQPIPKGSYDIPRLTNFLYQSQKMALELKSVHILNHLSQKLFKKDPSLILDETNQAQEIVSKIFKNLQEINKVKNSTLVIVYLPIQFDYMLQNAEQWRHFLHSEATKHNFLFIDLIDEFRKYPPQEVETLFRRDLHYTEKGNSYIANIMYEKLLSIPEIAYKLREK